MSATRPGASESIPSQHDGHGHSHGLVHQSIKRSREGIRAVLWSLAVLGVGAVAQTMVFVASGSVALLADLIHNFGDALTAIPVGIAFALRSEVAERRAGLFVVAAIFISACVAAVEAVHRLISPTTPTHLGRSRSPVRLGMARTSSRRGSGREQDSASTAPPWSPTAHTPVRTPTSASR